MAARLRVAVDVGGTFTDICVLDEDAGDDRGREGAVDRPTRSTPCSPASARRGSRPARRRRLLPRHTVATNALITRNFPPAAMVTTTRLPGRDRDPPRDEGRPLGRLQGRRRRRTSAGATASRWASASTTPARWSSRSTRTTRAASPRVLRKRGVQTVAVCFINSYANPAQRAAHARDPRGGAPRREHLDLEPRSCRRSSSTSASRRRSRTPCSRRSSAATCSGSRRGSSEGGYDGDVLLLHSGGGVMTPKTAERSPCGWPPRASPPARSRAATSRRSAATRTRSVSTWAARAPTSRSSTAARSASRRSGSSSTATRSCFPSIEVLTIGAGGGSLAWIDEAGSLRNGPQSAGANPGPRVLRARQRPADEHRRERRARPARLGADRRRDAARPRRRRAGASPSSSASRSASSVEEAANAIIQVANANMADAVRLISIRRGYDPREFALVVFGGAGPLHGADARAGARRSRPCSCRRTRGSPPRSAACSSTCATTSRRCSSRQVDDGRPGRARGRVREARDTRRASGSRPRTWRRSR